MAMLLAPTVAGAAAPANPFSAANAPLSVMRFSSQFSTRTSPVYLSMVLTHQKPPLRSRRSIISSKFCGGATMPLPRCCQYSGMLTRSFLLAMRLFPFDSSFSSTIEPDQQCHNDAHHKCCLQDAEKVHASFAVPTAAAASFFGVRLRIMLLLVAVPSLMV